MELTDSMVGLLGTVIGGGLALSSSVLGSVFARRDLRRVRRDSVCDLQRAACVAFLTQGDIFRDRARELSSLLDAGRHRGDPDVESCRGIYDDEWAKFAASCAVVQIGGPQEVAALAQVFSSKLGDWSELLEELYLQEERPRARRELVEKAWQARVDAYDEVWTARVAFIEASQERFA